MANRKRDVQILLWVTPEEKKMIRKRMILSKTSNMSVYLRKMAIDGMIVNTDTSYLKAMYQEMHKIGVNINQLAKVAKAFSLNVICCLCKLESTIFITASSSDITLIMTGTFL